MKLERVQVGNNDLRLSVDSSGGFFHVTLEDVDDGDVIVVNEDDLPVLVDRLIGIIEVKRIKEGK